MLFGKKKTVKKNFENWYNGSDNGVPNIEKSKKFLEDRPYLVKLQNIIQPGKKISKKTVTEFWNLFHEAQRDAFEAGQE